MHIPAPKNGRFLALTSMFVSYAYYTIWTVTTFLVAAVWLNLDLDYYLIGLIPTLILLTPFFFRMARRTWLTLFVKPNLPNADLTATELNYHKSELDSR